MTIALTRRAFVRAGLSAAGGLAVAALPPGFAAAARISAEPWSADAGAGDEIGAFVAIDPDNSITLRVAKSEMGQGVLTSLAMILAEEAFACDLSRVQNRIRLRPAQPAGKQRLSVNGHRRLLVGAPIARVPAAGGRRGPGALIAAAATR